MSSTTSTSTLTPPPPPPPPPPQPQPQSQAQAQAQAQPRLLTLPPELLLQIGTHLGPTKSLASFILTNRLLATTLTPLLYGLSVASPTRGRIPLFHAARTRNLPLLAVLLHTYRADINAADELQQTPLHIACLIPHNRTPGHRSIPPELLLASPSSPGAAPSTTPSSSSSSSPSPSSFSSPSSSSQGCYAASTAANTVRMMLSSGAAVNAQTCCGWTPLHHAIGYSGSDVVRALLDAGADVETDTMDGWSALHFAGWGEREDVLRLLLRRGADVDRALERLVRVGEEEKVARLLRRVQAEVVAERERGT